MVPPNHPLLIEFSIINHPFWGTPIFGNTQFFMQSTNSKCPVQQNGSISETSPTPNSSKSFSALRKGGKNQSGPGGAVRPCKTRWLLSYSSFFNEKNHGKQKNTYEMIALKKHDDMEETNLKEFFGQHQRIAWPKIGRSKKTIRQKF